MSRVLRSNHVNKERMVKRVKKDNVSAMEEKDGKRVQKDNVRQSSLWSRLCYLFCYNERCRRWSCSTPIGVPIFVCSCSAGTFSELLDGRAELFCSTPKEKRFYFESEKFRSFCNGLSKLFFLKTKGPCKGMKKRNWVLSSQSEISSPSPGTTPLGTTRPSQQACATHQSGGERMAAFRPADAVARREPALNLLHGSHR